MQQQISQLAQRFAATPAASHLGQRNLVSLDQPTLPVLLPSPVDSSSRLQAAKAESALFEAEQRMEAKKAAMQQQLLMDQQEAQRLHQEAAEKEAAIVRKKMDMQRELQVQRELLQAEIEKSEKGEHQTATKPKPSSEVSETARRQPAVVTVHTPAPAPVPAPAPAQEPSVRAPGRQSRTAVRLPEGYSNHFFIRLVASRTLVCSCLMWPCLFSSHSQSSGGDQANTLYLEFERLGEQRPVQRTHTNLHSHVLCVPYFLGSAGFKCWVSEAAEAIKGMRGR